MNTKSELYMIIFQHGENDFGCIDIRDYPASALQEIESILCKYDTIGTSARGSARDIAEEVFTLSER